MYKLIFAVLMVSLFSRISIAAQDEQALLRITSLTYHVVSEGVSDSIADVYLDGELIFDAIPYPFTTDYIDAAPGDHLLTTVLTGEDAGQGAEFPIHVEAGGQYSVIAQGEYTEGIHFVLVDESEISMYAAGSAAVVV